MKYNLFNMNYDRRVQQIDYLDSIKYMESKAYKQAYGDERVWEVCKRNHKGTMPREVTRSSCINEEGFVRTSYPCSICKDEYLILHYENYKLLEQFINPYTGQIYTTQDHGLCFKQYRLLQIAIYRAINTGTLVIDLPDRLYDYSLYRKDTRELMSSK